MKVVQISDELYDKLKKCVIDPFDDTPESVIGRLIEIAEKAKTKWSPLEAHVTDAAQQAESKNKRPEKPEHWKEQAKAVL